MAYEDEEEESEELLGQDMIGASLQEQLLFSDHMTNQHIRLNRISGYLIKEKVLLFDAEFEIDACALPTFTPPPYEDSNAK